MKYSLWNFRDWLEENGISLSYQISDNDAYIEQIRLDNAPPDITGICASVVDGSALHDCSGFRSALCFRNNRLLFPVASSEQILNLSMNMMEYYNKREADLYEQLSSGSSIQEILDNAASVTGFPIAYLKNAHTIGNHSSGWKIALTDRIVKELLRQLKKPSFRFPYYYVTDASSFAGTVLAKPLNAGKDSSFVLLHDADGRFKPGDLHIFSAMVEVIRHAVMFQSDRSAKNSHPLTDWYRASLFEEQVPHVSLPLLDQLGWKQDDYYQIACLTSDDTSGKAKETGFSDLVRTVPGTDCCCLVTPDGMSVLIHLGEDYPARFGGAAAFLEQLCVANGLKVGYSLPFHTLSGIKEHYQQSVCALSLCKCPGEQSVKLSEILADKILNKCNSLPGTQTYIHPDIQVLAEMEEREKEPLLETLYTYLILGRSASHAAQVLYIHRNTMRARLEKIQRHLSFSIEEYNNIGHILISLMITRIPGRS